MKATFQVKSKSKAAPKARSEAAMSKSAKTKKSSPLPEASSEKHDEQRAFGNTPVIPDKFLTPPRPKTERNPSHR